MNTKEIDERFDKKWGSGLYANIDDFGGLNIGNVKQNRWIKDFIHSELSTLRQSVLEEVREKVLKLKYDGYDDEACDQVTSLINNLIEEK